MTEPLTNWARNFTFSAREVLHPASVDEVQRAVHDRDRIKVLGPRHSFNDIGDSEHTILVLDSLPAQISLRIGNSVLPDYLWAICGRPERLTRVAHRVGRAFVASDARPPPWTTLHCGLRARASGRPDS